MPLIADEPPIPRPRTSGVDEPVAAWTVDTSPQLASARSVGQMSGAVLPGGGVPLPASINSTRAVWSSDSRAAITHPAVPAPTTTKSYDIVGEFILASLLQWRLLLLTIRLERSIDTVELAVRFLSRRRKSLYCQVILVNVGVNDPTELS